MGSFTETGGLTTNYVARWDGADWHALDTGLGYFAWAGAWADGKLYVGGLFNTAGGSPSNLIAAWATDPDFDIQATPTNIAACPGSDPTYDLTLASYNGYTDTVTLSALGNPAGTSAVFGQNPITPPDSTTLDISNTAAAAPGSYSIDIVGVATTRTHTSTVGLDILSPAPMGAATLLMPVNGATGVPNQPGFSWTAVTDADQYLLEVATDAAFNTIVYSKTVTGTSHTAETPLAGGTEHFWRITAGNLCGSGPVSTTFSFTTQDLAPDVGVSPSSFNVVLEPGTSTDEILTISNNGTAELEWTLFSDLDGTCASANSIPWLLVLDDEGATPPSAVTNVIVTFSVPVPTEGAYTGSLCLASNDSDTPLINIPLTLTVTYDDFKIYLPAVLK
jgi:hypothetical protein